MNITLPSKLTTYLDKLKMETNTAKILYTSDLFYKQRCAYVSRAGRYYKDYHKLIVARPKNMIFLKLVPAALALYKNQIKYRFNNVTINQLHLDVFLHEDYMRRVCFLCGLASLTPRMELTTFVDLLKYVNIKMLTITFNCNSDYLPNLQKLKYNQEIHYFRQHIQKYCNDVQVNVYFHGISEINCKCEFWKNDNYPALHNLGDCCCKIYSWGIVNKTNYNFHRNFKLEHRKKLIQ